MPMDGAAIKDVRGRVRQTIERRLRGFAPRTADILGEPVYGVEGQWGRPFQPWELRFLLVDVIACEDWGRAEKVA